MTPEAFISHLRADAARMAELATRELDAEVPPCPGWTVREAVLHTGEVYSHKVACMRSGQPPQSYDDWLHGPADGEGTVSWFRARLEELVTELEERGPRAPTYTWYEPDQTVGFWYRRMAQETVVHRVDVESAFAAVTPVDHELALDGIDEVLEVFLRNKAAEVGPDGPGRGTVAVRTGDHIWRVTLRPDDVGLERSPGRADAVLSGEPSELLLWLWGRRPDSAVTAEGAPELVAALRRRLSAVTQ
jgi:uncharacterized protein (TIGR03083 family)